MTSAPNVAFFRQEDQIGLTAVNPKNKSTYTSATTLG